MTSPEEVSFVIAKVQVPGNTNILFTGRPLLNQSQIGLSVFRLYKKNNSNVELIEESQTFVFNFYKPSSNSYFIAHCYQNLIDGKHYETYYDLTENGDFVPCSPKVPNCCEALIQLTLPAQFLPYTVLFGNPGVFLVQDEVVECHELWNINTYDTPAQFPITITGQGIAWVGIGQNDLNPGIFAGNMACANTDLGTQPNLLWPNLLFPAGGTGGREIIIRGSLDINSYVFNSCNICMWPNSAMTYTGILEILNSEVHDRTCTAFNVAWDGIISRGANTRFIGTNSNFQGAYNVLLTESNSLTQLRLNGNDFFRSYLGVNIRRPSAIAVFQNNTFGNNDGLFPGGGLGCNFSTPIARVPGNQMYAGIWAESNLNVSLPTTAVNNLFERIANGIYLDDAHAGRISGCRFHNMLNGAYLQGGGADDGRGIVQFVRGTRVFRQIGLGRNSPLLTFNNCREGIHIGIQGGSVRLSSTQNRMGSVNGGITIIGGQNSATGLVAPNSLISENQIAYIGVNSHGILVTNLTPAGAQTLGSGLTISNNGILGTNANGTIGISISGTGTNFLASTTSVMVNVLNNSTVSGPGNIINGGQKGLMILNTGNVHARNNQIQSNTTPNAVANIESTASQFNFFACNTLVGRNNGWARSIWGNLSPNNIYDQNATSTSTNGIEIAGNNNPSTIRCNTISGHVDGLAYTNLAVNAPQFTPTGVSHGNRWLGTFQNRPANGVSFGGNPLGMQFRILPNQMTGGVGLVNPPNWFVANATGSIGCTTCNTQIGDFTRTITSIDTDLMANSNVPSDATTWLRLRSLYADILRESTLQQPGSSTQQFLSQQNASDFGKFATLSKSIDAAITAPSDLILQFTNDAEQAIDALIQLDDLLQNGADIDAQAGARSIAQTQLANANNGLQSVKQANLNTRLALQPGMLQTLQSTSPVLQPSINEKLLLSIYLTTSFIDQPITTGQEANILAIANQCEYEGGYAVAWARAWYHKQHGVWIEPGNCTQNRASNEVTEFNDRFLTLSPNPVSDVLHLNLRASHGFALPFQVSDTNGKIIETSEIPAESKTWSLNTAHFPPGVYFLHLDQNTLRSITYKFVVIKL
jgi:Secretion system C-terminal sorting domain